MLWWTATSCGAVRLVNELTGAGLSTSQGRGLINGYPWHWERAGRRYGCGLINELACGEHNGGSEAFAAKVPKRATLRLGIRLGTSPGLNNELDFLCRCTRE